MAMANTYQPVHPWAASLLTPEALAELERDIPVRPMALTWAHPVLGQALQARAQLYAVRGGMKFPVDSLEDAAAKWDSFVQAAGQQGHAGVSVVGNGVDVVDQDGRPVGRVSYNGRIWPAGGAA
jgi:hypothetical protein